MRCSVITNKDHSALEETRSFRLNRISESHKSVTVRICGNSGALRHVFDMNNAFMVPKKSSYHFSS
ncbi:hypothetical protein PGB90_001860 [Kerria lacca]